MTAENVRQNSGEEFRLAETALRAAEALLGLGLFPDAASRAYYAVFHAARALLFSIGIEPRSHQALRTLIARHMVGPQALSAERSKQLAQLEALRSAGDYDSAFALGLAELRPEVEKARGFVEDARRILEKQGVLGEAR